MVFKKMFKNLLGINFFIILTFYSSSTLAKNQDFERWLNEFKTKAINTGISQNVVEEVLAEAKFLPKVIEYDRYQPEFYEDTFTYIKKGLVKKRLKKVLHYIKRKKNY